MFEVFEKYLRKHTDISDQELEIIRTASTERKLRKWQSILHEGEVWRYNCFIASGCCRLYRFDKNGTDHTVRFGVENWWITDQESFNHETASAYNIEALAASTVILWTKAQWLELLQTIPALKLFYERLTANAYEASQRRIYYLISYSATEKYLEFEKTYPSIFNNVPLHMVASYLGISRETLSRIRKDFTRSTINLPENPEGS
ncbi:Crp/Fnr family transcriptional regulator [Dyadobacter chenwenxiniae]|uniref:Crp/Fnr family transcriptional regulator n=1 Tax=Dyadobacter chenwenxiniae TaxID=2906456 RepID=A0A9X1PPG8_9BACT|nr:Crp/Fnr family transcriptional regulator [Dyadobacter chenwenxiniae]MCF0064658.1 Crp/Fnr family transcriptional regulator [Dyadobacter chenwenxiniae]UON84289.1 Crp/Fnr family transcriptional regulator [Dyadobacter chenwenxiniae]